MDPNQRKRKAPPLPKFQQQKQRDSKVVEKVTDFLQQISKQVIGPQILQKQNTASIPNSKNQGDKKKFNFASISSKLNSIMSAKNIDLNKVVESSKKLGESHHLDQPRLRRDIEIQYDPANPNSYEQSKSHYTQTLQKLKMSNFSNKFSNTDEKISKLIAQFQRNGEQIEQQQLGQIIQPDVNRLDHRQSLALRMMQKHGFKVGDGLGKQNQGIKTPLTIKKLTDSSCRIEPSSLSLANFVTIEQSANNALLAFKIQKSPVIALKIAMKLNELTDEIELQIKQECANYGKIEEWLAFMTQQTIIFFCQYQTIDQAFKAFIKINGRYYDERIINVFFYPRQLFEIKNFSQPLHQVVQF